MSMNSRLSLIVVYISLAIVLFVAGFLFGYWLFVSALDALYEQMWGELIEINEYAHALFRTRMSIGIGLSFELPLVVALLLRKGRLRSQDLYQRWRLALVVLATIAAVITPSIGIIEMLAALWLLLLIYWITMVVTIFLYKPYYTASI